MYKSKNFVPLNLAKIEIKIKRNKTTVEVVRTNEKKLGKVFNYLENKYQPKNKPKQKT